MNPSNNTVFICLENHHDRSAVEMMNALYQNRPAYFRTFAFEQPFDRSPETLLAEIGEYFTEVEKIAAMVQQPGYPVDFALWPDLVLQMRLTQLYGNSPQLHYGFQSLKRVNTQKLLYATLQERLAQGIQIACIDIEKSTLNQLNSGAVSHASTMERRDRHFFEQLESLRAHGNVLMCLGLGHRAGLEFLITQSNLKNHYVFVNTISQGFALVEQAYFQARCANPKDLPIVLSSPEQTADVAQRILQRLDLMLEARQAGSLSAYNALKQRQREARPLASTVSELPPWRPSAG